MNHYKQRANASPQKPINQPSAIGGYRNFAFLVLIFTFQTDILGQFVLPLFSFLVHQNIMRQTCTIGFTCFTAGDYIFFDALFFITLHGNTFLKNGLNCLSNKKRVSTERIYSIETLYRQISQFTRPSRSSGSRVINASQPSHQGKPWQWLTLATRRISPITAAGPPRIFTVFRDTGTFDSNISQRNEMQEKNNIFKKNLTSRTKSVTFRLSQNGTGKLVWIQHGPATVTENESRNISHWL